MREAANGTVIELGGFVTVLENGRACGSKCPIINSTRG